jgi:hypothetical protein
MALDGLWAREYLAHQVLRYLDLISIVQFSSVSTTFHALVNQNGAEVGLWSYICRLRGLSNTKGSTRTRGKRTWHRVFMSSVCINCYDTQETERGASGHVLIDTQGGSSLKRSYQQSLPVGAFGSCISICSHCLNDTVTVYKFSERQKCCLQNLKRRKQGAFHLIWNDLLNKIPADNAVNKAKSGGESSSAVTLTSGGARTNDFLLKKILEKKSKKQKLK